MFSARCSECLFVDAVPRITVRPYAAALSPLHGVHLHVFQYDLLHLLFNMLWLYWFGQLFLLFFNAKQFGGVYILGGLSGAAVYLFAYNLLPYFVAVEGMLLGASAAVLAVVFAVSAYAPDYKIRLLFIGNISIKYIALITVLIDLLSITSQNAGGHIAHIGGALFGFLFALRYKKEGISQKGSTV